jgi:hypothetical protein
LETDGIVPDLGHVTNAVAVELQGIDIVGGYGISCRLTRPSGPVCVP